MNERPSFQFYPRDWLNDLDLQGCSLQAQAIMIAFLCVSHDSQEVGFLSIGREKKDPFSDQKFAKKCSKIFRIAPKKFQKILRELVDSGVLKQDDEGCVYCARMVRNQRISDIRSAAGRLGGNPDLLNQTDKQSSKQKPTPSFTTSFSSSSSLNTPPTTPPSAQSQGSCGRVFSRDEEDCIRLLVKYATKTSPAGLERTLRQKAREGCLDKSRLEELRAKEKEEQRLQAERDAQIERVQAYEKIRARQEVAHQAKDAERLKAARETAQKLRAQRLAAQGKNGVEGPVTSLSSPVGDDARTVPPAESGDGGTTWTYSKI